MPKVSVIIPNYNHASFLPQRIETVLVQTFRDFEIILLDDKSTDNSQEIISKYKSHPSFSTIVFNEKNSGSTFLQWEKGFGLANGEYIWIAESDDYCEPAFLETMVKALDENPQAGVAYCQCFRVNENGKEINDFRQWKDPHWPKEFYLDGREMAINHFMNGRAIPNASTAVFRKEMIPTDRYFTTFRYSGDIIFWLCILAKSGIVVVNERLNYFRKHEKSVSSSARLNGLEIIEGLKIISFAKIRFDLNSEIKQMSFNRLAHRLLHTILASNFNVSPYTLYKIFVNSFTFDKIFVLRFLAVCSLKIFDKITGK